jgi:hypothetical protein
MHPELRRARGLYHDWRLLPERERNRIAPAARDVRELALDMRGYSDSGAAERRMADANDTLAGLLRSAALPRAA